MTIKNIHGAIHNVLAILIFVTFISFVYSLNKEFAIIFFMLFTLRTIAKFLYNFEQAKEDYAVLKEFDKILKMNDTLNKEND